MILQALNSYYHRLANDPEKEIPVPGFSSQKIHFALLLDPEGNLKRVLDLRIPKGKKQVAREINASAVKRSSGIAPAFGWDNTGYVLGADNKGNLERSRKMFEAFKEFHHQLCDNVEDEGVQAVLSFLDKWNPDKAAALEYWEEMSGQNLVFQLDGDFCFVHERAKAKEIWIKYQNENASDVIGRCLVSGQSEAIARLHPSIKGVRGAQTAGASIVSFNLDAFISYNKQQSYNAPVSESAAFAYTTALNWLLRSDSRQKIQIGDASTVFWSECSTPMEGMFGMIFDTSNVPEDNKPIHDYLESVRKGKMPEELDNPDVKFFILGLSPNAARISVRYWHVSSVREISEKLAQHFDALQIQRNFDNEPEYPGMWQLLRETAALGKLDNVSPLLAGAFMRSILTGSPYPRSLISAIITRIRSDQKINYLRAAMIKGYLIRQHRRISDMEVTMALNRESKNVAYRLGRLFAVLEKVQKDANPGINATIKDRYYGAASATPRAVFPQLMRLAQHHIEKAEYGHVSDKRIEEILQDIQTFPGHLSIEEQGLFALGYYHQRPELYKKSEEKKEN